MIPVFVMGLTTRDKHTGVSTLDIRAVRTGMAAGLFAALIFEIVPTLYNIFGGGVLPAVLITVAGTLIPHFLLKRKNI